MSRTPRDAAGNPSVELDVSVTKSFACGDRGPPACASPCDRVQGSLSSMQGRRGQTKIRSWRILVVDDHAGSRKSMAHILGLCGHVCTQADSAVSALLAIDTFEPEAIVLEWNLRNGSGRGLSRLLRERVGASARGRQLVVLIASTADEPRGFRIAEDVDAYFTKPISMIRIAELLVAIDRDRATG